VFTLFYILLYTILHTFTKGTGAFRLRMLGGSSKVFCLWSAEMKFARG